MMSAMNLIIFLPDARFIVTLCNGSELHWQQMCRGGSVCVRGVGHTIDIADRATERTRKDQ
jgi:hypothetical protein